MLFARKYFNANLLIQFGLILTGLSFSLIYPLSNFETACFGLSLFLAALQMIQFSKLEYAEAGTNRGQYILSYLLAISSVLFITMGVLLIEGSILLLFPNGGFVTIGLSGGIILCLFLQLFDQRKNKKRANYFFKFTVLLSLVIPLTLVIINSLVLTTVDSKETQVLSSLTVIIFGVLSLLASIKVLFALKFQHKKMTDNIKQLSLWFKQKKLVFTRITIVKDALLVSGKGILSVLSISFFMFINALYSAGMGATRFMVLKMHMQEEEKQIKHYRIVGAIIMSASICYILYSVRLLFGGKTGVYSMNLALVIALYTFVEFGINVREAFRLRKSKALEEKALRAISFSSTLICFVLTQTAIMSFTAPGDNSFSNALSGIVFGSAAALTGVIVIIDSYFHEKEYKSTQKSKSS